MSGIVGIYYLDGRPVDRLHLERMTSMLAHRGPDGQSVWHMGSVGFGHRLLSTTPESLVEKLPLEKKSSCLAITSDARIDNRGELIGALNLNGRHPDDITDTDLILAAYEKWGRLCPEKLIGDFAFAIWDDRKKGLFCARDHMGVKPFYYFCSDRLFIFSTEIKSLFCASEVPCRLNETKVADHLAAIFEDKRITFYQDIRRLPPAHCLWVTLTGNQLKRYWEFDGSVDIRLSSDGEYAEAFREIFTEAVRCRLRSAYPVGATLSGGLDSSSIACTARDLMKEMGKGRLHTFSAIFPDLPKEDLKNIDERHYIDSVLATGGYVPHHIRADRLRPLFEFDDATWQADEAVLGPNLYIHRAMHRAAYKNGVRVFLDGIDGDTTVSHGYEYLTELARKGRWLALANEAGALAALVKQPRRKIIYRFGVRPLIPEFIIKGWRIVQGRNGSNPFDCAIVKSVFAKRIGLADRVKGRLAGLNAVRTAREMHLYGLNQGLNAHAMQQLDNTTASLMIEPRYPFFDRRLMAFCLALPPDQKMRMGWQRIILRRAMDGILPEEVQWRHTKANLGLNFTRRLLGFEQKTIERVVHHESEAIEMFVDIPTLRNMFTKYVSDPMNKSEEAIAIYGVVTLWHWLKKSGFH